MIRVPKYSQFVFKERIRVRPCPSIRVPKTFVLFERFVFKEKIRVHPSVCQKYSLSIRAIRVQKNLCSSVPSVGE